MERFEVLEGTWEELAAHAETFKGCKLRLIVLSSETTATHAAADETMLRTAAARLLDEADHLKREPGPLRDDPYKTAFGEIVAEKHRRMGVSP